MLRYAISIFMLLIALRTFAQVDEHFDDLNFTANPTWSGDTSRWSAVTGQLQSNGAAVTPDTIYLSTPSATATNAEWRFYADIKTSLTSGNYAEVHLVSDVADLKLPHNGYFVRVGNTSKNVALYLKQGTTETLLISGPVNLLTSSSNNPVNVKVTRDASNLWSLYADATGTGTSYALQGTVTDNTITSSNYFGVLVKHSASTYNKYYFDDLYAGPIVVDTVAPSIVSATALSATQVDVLFSENVTSASAQVAPNYNINNSIGAPSTATLDAVNHALVHLTLSTPLANGTTYTVTANNVSDLNNNALTSDTATFVYSVTSTTSDVIINEIMGDPTPVVQLPAVEYVELFNRGTQSVDITNWIITDGSSNGIIPSYNLPAGGFVILTSATNQPLFTSYGAALGVTSFPSLNNSGDNLVLKNASGAAVDHVNYSDTWYHDATKKDGGWSLERINPFTPCNSANNWTASNDMKGGTPGAQNSVYNATPDTVPPILTSAVAAANDTILLQFNESLDSTNAANPSLYSVTDNQSQSLPVASVAVNPSNNTVLLATLQPLSIGNTYTVSVTNISDCAGNTNAQSQTETVVIPDTASAGDVVINEILFNPISYGFDYVELYNRSAKYLDASQLQLWNTNTAGQLYEHTNASPSTRLVAPNGYLLVTEDTAWVRDHYPTHDTKNFIQVSTLPSYDDASGTVVLKNSHGLTVDSLRYSSVWQFALLENPEGVALERISATAPTQDSMNWHSAATAVGYGTPGLPNSERIEENAASNDITLDPKIFSPDQDGHNDVLIIRYQFATPGYVVNIKIFNEAGSLVKDLVQGRLAEPKGFATWNGTDSNNERAAVGPYAVWVEAFKPDGSVKYFKKTCVLAGKK